MIDGKKFLKQLLELARDVLEAENKVDPVEEQDKAKAAFTELLQQVTNAQTPVIVERVVADIDEIVRMVRFPGWQHTSTGEREAQKTMRRTFADLSPAQRPQIVRPALRVYSAVLLTTMNNEDTSLRDPSSWVYYNVDPTRERNLRTAIPLQQLVTGIVNGRVSTQKPPFVECNIHPLTGVVTNSVFPPGVCKRIVFFLVINRDLHDVFVNGISGLFGRYFQSAREGRDATKDVIRAVKESDSMFRSATRDDKAMELLWHKSLNGDHAIVWFDEDEFPAEKYKRGSLVFVGSARPQITNGHWRPRPVFTAGTRIVVKGAWIAPHDEIAILESKRNNDDVLFKNGFA